MSEDQFIELVRIEFPEEKEIHLGKEYRQLSGWSSLNALIFVSSLKNETGVLISPKELANTKTLGELFKLLS